MSSLDLKIAIGKVAEFSDWLDEQDFDTGDEWRKVITNLRKFGTFNSSAGLFNQYINVKISSEDERKLMLVKLAWG